MAFPVSPIANQTYTTAGGVTYVYNNGAWTVQTSGSAGAGGGSGGGTGGSASVNLTVVTVPLALTLLASHSGSLIECADTTNITIPAGLPAGFNVTFSLPNTGSITLTPAVGVSINGSLVAQVRNATNFVLGLIPTSGTDAYKLTGV